MRGAAPFLVLLLAACGGTAPGSGEDLVYLDAPWRFGRDGEDAPLPDVPPGEDVAGPGDVLVPPDAETPADLSEIPDAPAPRDHAGDTPGDTAPEDTPGSLDLQLPDAGPCGGCPPETPNCVGGVCKCTPFSCGEGTYCKGGSCVPCTVDAHCGPECLSCPSMNRFCSADGSQCLDCDDTHPCPASQSCIDNVCTPCEALGFCGPSCVTCPPETPACVGGACECTPASCPVQAVCEGGACVPCTTSDPAHCGPQCLACGGAKPHCLDGACVLCNSPAACGPACQPCSGGSGLCLPAGTGCVECLDDGDCDPAEHCAGNACVPDCTAQGCTTDGAPSGNKCSTAKIIGRVPAAAGYQVSADTTGDGDNDNLPSFGGPDCWDAQVDNFYRLWFNTGDLLTVTADPVPADFNLSLKLYRGTTCDDNWEDDLLACEWDNDGGKAETIVHAATQDGWHTLVVDGASAFSDQYDWGAYSLSVTLACADAGCCCP